MLPSIPVTLFDSCHWIFSGRRLAQYLGGFAALGCTIGGLDAAGYFSAQESKLSLVAGSPVVNDTVVSDEIQYVDTANSERNVGLALANSVIGPPSNLAHSSRSGWLLVADSVAIEEGVVGPSDYLWAVPFGDAGFGSPHRIKVGSQPSGIDMDTIGVSALVANRKDGTIAALRLQSDRWVIDQSLQVGSVHSEPTDVTIAPDGLRAAYVLRQAQEIGFLSRSSTTQPWKSSGSPLSVPGLPYRIVFSPDGGRAFTNLAAEQGGNGKLQLVDNTEVGWALGPMVDLGYPDPETVEISIDGRWLVIPMMAGSNLPESAEGYDSEGRILIYEIGGDPRLFQTLPCGAIPEGAAFSPDGLELVVQGHVDRELWVYRRAHSRAQFELAETLPMNGHPSALISFHDE
jgi:hypothetical protein